MRSLSCTRPGTFNYIDGSMPIKTPGHSILQLKRVGICGTDLHAYEGTQPYFEYPRILGHEVSAIIKETENNSGFTVGEAVTILPYFNCGHCIACRNNKPNCCVHIKVFGVHIDGGMREFIVVPDDKLLKNGGLDLDALALIEPLSIGAHAISRARVMKGEFVLIVGAGPIGLGIMELARIDGAEVIAMDMNEDRLQFCGQQLHIAHTINPAKDEVLQRLKEITHNDMPTVIFDATGNLKAIDNGINYLAHGGRYVLVGLQKEAMSFSHPEFHKRETTLMSSRNATKDDFLYVIDAFKKGLVKPENFITHRTAFTEVPENFSSWLDPKNKVIKAMVYFD
ncbi:MAG TPA: zinc-binding alcohol dehydrogenase family protein [Parafilimonas sp.]|nr:zinc-binding alcohol dehydrogenase family protein [Parafilimonas sp.]